MVQGLASIAETIGESITNLGEFVSNIADFIKQGFENITETITTSITDIIEFFGERITDIIDTILSIPTLFQDMFEYLFIPENNPFETLIETISSKFPIIEDIKNILGSFSVKNGSSVSLKFILYGQTYELVNFDWLNSSWYGNIRLFIVGLIYFRYLTSLYKKLPSLIRGGVA